MKRDLGGQAIPLLESAVKQVPNDPTFHYHLGTAYFKASDWAKARVELEKTLTLAPEFPAAADVRKTLAIVGTSSSR